MTALSRSNPTVKKLLAATFPDYNGRKISVVPFDKPLNLDLSWSGGTCDKVVLIDLSNGRIGKLVVPSPWARGAADPVDCPPNSLLVVRSWFCGTDCGITIYVPAASALERRFMGRPSGLGVFIPGAVLAAAPRSAGPCSDYHDCKAVDAANTRKLLAATLAATL